MVSHGVGLKNDRRTRLVAPGCPCPNPVLFVLEKLASRFAASSREAGQHTCQLTKMLGVITPYMTGAYEVNHILGV